MDSGAWWAIVHRVEKESDTTEVTSHLQAVTFSSSFPICIPFILLSSLFTMATTSKTMLNKTGKSGSSCLVPDLRGNALGCRVLVHGFYFTEVGSLNDLDNNMPTVWTVLIITGC